MHASPRPFVSRPFKTPSHTPMTARIPFCPLLHGECKTPFSYMVQWTWSFYPLKLLPPMQKLTVSPLFRIEINLALICSSAPALRALIMKHAPKILSYGSRSSGSEVKSIVNRSGGSRGGTSRAQGRIVIQYDSSAATEKHEEASVNEVEVGTPTSGARSPRRTDFV